MEKYWKHNTKARIHEWFDRRFRKKHYIESMNLHWEKSD